MIAVETAFDGSQIRARVHDRKSPLHLEDFQRVWLVADLQEVDMRWYGEYLWRAPLIGSPQRYHVCAKDRAGNQACSPDVERPSPADDFPPAGDHTAVMQPGGCCDAGRSPAGSLALALLVGFALSARSRSRSRDSGSARRRRRSA